MQKLISQIWHDIRKWEEIAHNMWGDVDDKKMALDIAIGFTSDHKLYGHYMRRVCDEWPISCENALTDPYLNQKAWVGHAAVALAHNIPEDITRMAWGHLTDEQKYLANKEAERAIAAWKERHISRNCIHGDVASQVLL